MLDIVLDCLKGSYDFDASHHPRMKDSLTKLFRSIAEKDDNCFFFTALGLRGAGAVVGYVISNVVDRMGVPFSTVLDCKKVVLTMVQ